MIALVFLFIFWIASSIFIFQVFKSQSTGTIFKLFLITDRPFEIIVKFGIITSLFFFILKDLTTISNAAVQFDTNIPYFFSTSLLNFSSNFSM